MQIMVKKKKKKTFNVPEADFAMHNLNSLILALAGKRRRAGIE